MLQMSPLNCWIFYIYFIIILIKISIINFNIIFYTPMSALKNKFINKSLNWKW